MESNEPMDVPETTTDTQNLLIQEVNFMSLKLKVMLILLCIFGLYGVMNFWVQRYVIFPGFLSLERDEAIKNVKRIEEAFKNEIHRLDSICWDWSAWNDSYQFIESRSAEYIETNLIPGTFAVNHINTIYFINTKEKIIWYKTYDPKYNRIIQLTDFPKDTFPPNHPLISYLSKSIPVTKMGVAGIYMTQNGPMFISSRPITKSNDEGPPRGSLIFGRFLNDEFVKTLEDQTKINFQVFPVHAGSLPAPLKDIPNRITDESRYLVDYSTNDSIYAYTTLPDIIGNAAILIKSQTPKKISEQGYVTVNYAMYLILAIGIGVLIVMSLLLHYSVLGPITDLKNHVMLIRKTGDISASPYSQRRDEIGILSTEFDRMLEQLQRFQTKLEVKVKERTSELAITNENLQQEIEERKQAEEALRESEEKYRSMMEAMQDLAYICSPEFHIEYMNPAMIKRTGRDATGESCYKVINGLEEKCPWCIQQDRIQQGEHYLTEIISPKDGLTYSVSYSPIHHVDGTISILSIYRDITEMKNMAKKLQRSQKMESMGLLAGGVAHDLNNILAGIIGYPDLLLLNLPEDSKLRMPIEKIQQSGHRAAAIVQDLLTIARGVATTKESLNLNDLLYEYLNSPEYEKLKEFHSIITIKTNFDSNLLNINGSYNHIRKIVMNLVSNACEAIEGSGNVTISTMNQYVDRPLKGFSDIKIGEYAVLAVLDDGPGISSGDLDRIFEPFYTKKVMGRSGTGLGLTVVWNAVQDHNGYIDVTTDDNGTTFKLYFPITREKVSDKDFAQPIKDLKGDGEKILVVDDVEMQREIFCNMLNTLGYKTKDVSSGEEAVNFLKENTVDLILLDMIMDPGINGLETYKRITKIHPRQKAVIVSGFAETDDVKEAQKLGAGRFIQKPLTLEKIGEVVKTELGK